MTFERFDEQLSRVGGVVYPVADLAAAASVIDGILAVGDPHRVAFSDGDCVAGVQALLTTPHAVAPNERDALLSCDVGITAAQWGIAETGSLVLDAGVERHRLTSLLPPVHIALLRA